MQVIQPNHRYVKAKRQLRRIITETIAELIVVATVIAVALAMVSWLHGIWHSEEANFIAIPSLRLESHASGGTPKLYLYIKNGGTSPVTIIEIDLEVSGGYFANRTPYVIEPGQELNIVIKDWLWYGSSTPPELSPGNKYRIKIYTDRLGVYILDVIASS